MENMMNRNFADHLRSVQAIIAAEQVIEREHLKRLKATELVHELMMSGAQAVRECVDTIGLTFNTSGEVGVAIKMKGDPDDCDSECP